MTTITQAEILFGLALLPAGKRRLALEIEEGGQAAIDLAVSGFSHQLGLRLDRCSGRKAACRLPAAALAFSL